MNVRQLKEIVTFMERYQFDITSIIGDKVNFKESDGDGYVKRSYSIQEIIKSNKPIN